MTSFAKWFLHVCRTSYDLWLQFLLVMHSKMEQIFRNERCWPAKLLWETILGSTFHQRYKCFGRVRVKDRPSFCNSGCALFCKKNVWMKYRIAQNGVLGFTQCSPHRSSLNRIYPQPQNSTYLRDMTTTFARMASSAVNASWVSATKEPCSQLKKMLISYFFVCVHRIALLVHFSVN